MSATTKPMYRKYYDVWAAHRDRYGSKVALLYQVGGFFEIYDTENLTTGTTQANIREIAELCQLSLTVHDAGDGFQTLFGGFPEHALGKFEKILVQAGYTVVVVVQRKGSSGAVEERVVDHISSPGCYVEGVKERRLVGVLLESLSDGAAALKRVYWAATALDVATGSIWFVEGVDRDRLHQFLCIHPPAELVLWSDGLAGANSLMESLKAACPANHVRCLGPASVAVDEAILERFWAPVRKRLDWLPRQPQARRCLAALMDFAADHMPSALKQLSLPEAWVPAGEVRLGNAALEQLGLLSLRSGDNDKQSLLGLMDQCRSVLGRRVMRARLMRPITEITELNRRLDLVDRCKSVSAADTVATERGLRSLYDISRLWRRLELGTASMSDMACLLRSFQAARGLLDVWGGPEEVEMFLGWVAVRWSVDAVVALAREGGSVPVSQLPWTPGYRPVADALFQKGGVIRTEAVGLCESWSGLGKGERLYLDDAEGGGFRVTGTKRRISAVLTVLRDEGDTTATTSTYKTSATLETAGLATISNRHRTWYGEWTPTWLGEWSAACAEMVQKGASARLALETWCAELDVAWTTARLATEWLWTRPVFVDGTAEASVAVSKLRHPILERLTTVPYVPHSVCLGTEGGVDATYSPRGLLLYGMNASGKSSLMKALGLAVLLAQTGFPVPASSMQLAPFSAIFTRILGNDNLWAGLSSFAVEMTEFREILRFADERSLVLGDELCSGTESLSATALVAAGVETLVGHGTKFVFATHLHELATLPDIASLSGIRAVHLKVHYDAAADRLIYERELAPGSGSALYGLEVCRALDLPVGFLERATVLRKSLGGCATPTTSRYTPTAVVDKCSICGSGAGLEMHHIIPQAEGAAAAAAGIQMHSAGNLVCLCATCHDEHHAGRLQVRGWKDTSAGRVLDYTHTVEHVDTEAPDTSVIAWIREQKSRKVRVPTIRRMAKQLFGVELTDGEIRGVH
jgi:DNA mismatch repair protein MutS